MGCGVFPWAQQMSLLVLQLGSHSFLWGRSLQCFHCHAAFSGRRYLVFLDGDSTTLFQSRNRATRAISHSYCCHMFWERSWCEICPARNSKILWWYGWSVFSYTPLHDVFLREKMRRWFPDHRISHPSCAWWLHGQMPGNDHSKHCLSLCSSPWIEAT